MANGMAHARLCIINNDKLARKLMSERNRGGYLSLAKLKGEEISIYNDVSFLGRSIKKESMKRKAGNRKYQ